MNVGPLEIAVVLFVALIVFGPKRLPEVGRQLGAAMRELRRMQDSVKAELDTVINPDVHPTSVAETEEPPALEPPAVEEPDHSTLPAAPSVFDAPATDDGFAGPGSFA
jgi:TatA/E family protein of Tat protein translocase